MTKRSVPGFDAADIPEYNGPGSSDPNYVWKAPDELTCCDYVYAMPHADPEWDSHSNLYTWLMDESTGGCRGWIYAACHAVSALENSFNDVDPDVTQQMNFLSNKTGVADIDDAPWAENSLVLWGDHDDGTMPYTYETSISAHPFMQFMGDFDDALENGSEQIFMPYAGTSWRDSVTIAVYDPDHDDLGGITNGPAAKLAYGPAMDGGTYDDYSTGNGWVMYMGGHQIDGDEENEVAAAQESTEDLSGFARSYKNENISFFLIVSQSFL